jgi:hypothetical protein
MCGAALRKTLPAILARTIEITPMHTDISNLFGYSERAPAALWCPLLQFLGKDPYRHAEVSSVPHPCPPEASGRVDPWFKAFGGEALPSAGKMPYSCGSGSAVNVKRPPCGDLSTPCCLVSITKTLSRPSVAARPRSMQPTALDTKVPGWVGAGVKAVRTNVKER